MFAVAADHEVRETFTEDALCRQRGMIATPRDRRPLAPSQQFLQEQQGGVDGGTRVAGYGDEVSRLCGLQAVWEPIRVDLSVDDGDVVSQVFGEGSQRKQIEWQVHLRTLDVAHQQDVHDEPPFIWTVVPRQGAWGSGMYRRAAATSVAVQLHEAAFH